MDATASPLVVAGVALTVVFASLGILAAMLFALRAAYQRSSRARPEGEEVDGELLAVLAAAAHQALGAPVRVHRVHVHRGRGDEEWTRAGRMDIMVSHRVVPKR